MQTHQKLQDEYELPRRRMIAKLREHYHIQDQGILQAMAVVPRHIFVPEAIKPQAYKDNALPIAAGQTISQPFIVAKMTELLAIAPDAKILEIGAGSGYQTAILAVLARKIFAIERIPQLARQAEEKISTLGFKNVVLKCGDGTNGWTEFAPFDGILVAAGSPSIPEPLVNQLKPGGRLVIPIGKDQKSQHLIRVTRTDRSFKTEDFGACAFVPLIGEHGWRANHEGK